VLVAPATDTRSTMDVAANASANASANTTTDTNTSVTA
jgi:hypothetical protein